MRNYMGEGAYPRYGTHTVEVSLQDGEYRGTVYLQIDGNTRGASILEGVLNTLSDGDFEPDMMFPQNLEHIETDGDGYVREYKLFKPGDEEELLIDFDEIGHCVVGVRITRFEDEFTVASK